MDESSALPVTVADLTLNGSAIERLYDEAREQAGQLVRQRVVTKLATAILLDIKADGPPPLPFTEHQARALLAALGKQLDEASQELAYAAERLKQRGDPAGASRVREASLRTKDAAQGVQR